MRTVGVLIYIVYCLMRASAVNRRYNKLKVQGKIEEAERVLQGIPHYYANKVLEKAGVKLQIKGVENVPNEACCFVGNHQGNLDPLALIAAIDKPIGFIAKKETKKLPVVSKWMENIKCVFIDRENVRESLKAINEGAENLKNGHSMAIFPEGTRSKSHDIGEFKKGSLKLATKANAPIVPVTIDGSYRIFEENNNRIKKGEIKVTFGKPIYIEKLSKEEQKDLAETVKAEIVKNLQ